MDKFYKAIIRPAMVYHIECWTSKVQLLPSYKNKPRYPQIDEDRRDVDVKMDMQSYKIKQDNK